MPDVKVAFARGQVVPHSPDDRQPGTGNVFRRIVPGSHRHQRIVGTVNDQRGCADFRQFPASVTQRNDRQQLLIVPGRVVRAPNGARQLLGADPPGRREIPDCR
jgi:hypothetical protein